MYNSEYEFLVYNFIEPLVSQCFHAYFLLDVVSSSTP